MAVINVADIEEIPVGKVYRIPLEPGNVVVFDNNGVVTSPAYQVTERRSLRMISSASIHRPFTRAEEVE